MKANFLNEIFELRSEIVWLKKHICDRSSNNVFDENDMRILKI